MRIVLTGGTGLIGRAVVAALQARGDDVVVVTREPVAARGRLGDRTVIVEGDPMYAGDWQTYIRGADAVVNLAGEPMTSRRWNAQFRQLIHDSRVESTRFVVEAIRAAGESERPRVMVSASGADYYPADIDLAAFTSFSEDDDVDERAPCGESFLARTCRDWEAEANEAAELGVRVVVLRTGIVLARQSALQRMALPFRFFVGGRLGSGRQWMSWIHIEDAVSAILFAIDTESVAGPVNLVAPAPVRNRDFARAIGKAMRRPAVLPTPGFVLKLAVGELAEAILAGRKVVPAVLLSNGYEYRFPNLDAALADLL